MTMKPVLAAIKRRKKMFFRSAILGLVLGLACHFVPPEYRDGCSAVTGALSLSCTGH